MEMTLVETRNINNVLVDGFYGEKQAWFTRRQIGEALEYADPQHAITLIHNKHKERLDKFSRGGLRLRPLREDKKVFYTASRVFLKSVVGVDSRKPIW